MSAPQAERHKWEAAQPGEDDLELPKIASKTVIAKEHTCNSWVSAISQTHAELTDSTLPSQITILQQSTRFAVVNRDILFNKLFFIFNKAPA